MRRTATFLLSLLLPLAVGCTEEESPTEPSPEALFSCLLGNAVTPRVGEVVLFEGERAQTLCLGAGEGGAEYLYVPFFASESGRATLTLELTGGGFEAGGGERFSRAPLAADPALTDEQFHVDLRTRERGELGRLIPAARAGREASPHRAARQATIPEVGELLSLNTQAACSLFDIRVGRVEAVSRTSIVVADTSNPPNGLERADFQFFAEAFDTLVNPVATQNFGEPTDIDENDRVIIFFTRAVNDLTEPGSGFFVGGFFWAGDLFPNEACPGSNTAEIFYLLVPDPERAAAGERAFEPSFVKRIAVGILGHEYQHLINAGRRIYVNDAESFEEVWLNEGLSHIAEELLFYAATDLEPRMNLDLETVVASRHREVSFFAYAASNFARFLRYLENPDGESLLGIGNLPTRGASWAFLRYAADQEDGPDAPFFRRLVDGREAGVANLANALTVDPLDLMQAWTVSVYTDDYASQANPPVPPLYVQPSWNFRSIMDFFTAEDGRYPLELVTPVTGQERAITLLGGGAAFVRFGVTPSGRALLRTTSGGEVPPERLRLSIVRLR